MTTWVIHAFQGLMASIVNGLIQFMFAILQSVEVTPFHPDRIPAFSVFLLAVQTVASGFLVAIFLKEWLINEFESLADTGVNPLSYMKNNIIAGVLIWVTPGLVTQLILPMSSYVSAMASDSVGNPAAVSADMTKALTVDPSMAATNFLVSIFSGDAFWEIMMVCIIMLILMIIVGISSGKRWMELLLLVAIGPLLALSKASYGGLWDAWLRQTLTAAFSQAVQYFAITISFNVFLNADTATAVAGLTSQHPLTPQAHVFIAIGAALFAATGPTYLRNLLMGPGGASGLRAVQSMASTAMMAAK